MLGVTYGYKHDETLLTQRFVLFMHGIKRLFDALTRGVIYYILLLQETQYYHIRHSTPSTLGTHF